MQHLWKTIWVIGVMIVLEGVKKLCDRIFVEATIFHHNFISCLQLILFLYLCLTLVFGTYLSRSFGPGRAKKYSLLIVLLLFASGELIFIYWFNHPRKIPPVALSSFRYYYNNLQRSVIQFNNKYSVYDSNLLYTLKPSARFNFRNSEFEDSFYINHKGLRDDESSLFKPDIIFLGDSYAMGWGVKQDDSFAQQLETLTGKKILNLAMSSYGTARELIGLDRVDISNLQYIIIQYCGNDIEENEKFISNNYSLPISSSKTYDSLKDVHYWSKVYFPGKYILTISRIYLNEKFGTLKESTLTSTTKDPGSDKNKTLKAAEYFMDILSRSTINFNKTKVVVFEVDNQKLMNNRFIAAVDSLSKSTTYKEYVKGHLFTVPVADLLTSKDYYILDQHLYSSGHEKIAKRLQSALFTKEVRP